MLYDVIVQEQSSSEVIYEKYLLDLILPSKINIFTPVHTLVWSLCCREYTSNDISGLVPIYCCKRLFYNKDFSNVNRLPESLYYAWYIRFIFWIIRSCLPLSWTKNTNANGMHSWLLILGKRKICTLPNRNTFSGVCSCERRNGMEQAVNGCDTKLDRCCLRSS